MPPFLYKTLFIIVKTVLKKLEEIQDPVSISIKCICNEPSKKVLVGIAGVSDTITVCTDCGEEK